jgi:hypothetical protein
MAIRHWFRRFRDAITGRFVSRSFAEDHPDTTVAEREPRDPSKEG